jgi:hypothetical protein
MIMRPERVRAAARIVLLLLACSLFPFFCSHGAEHVVLYRFGTKDPAPWEQLRRYLTAKGFRISMFDGPDSLEKQIENVNKINKLKASILLAVDLNIGAKNQILVAMTISRRGKGNFLAIDEVPGEYANESRDLAGFMGSAFKVNAKELPLFPLLGVDMPGIYLKVDCTPDKTTEVFDKLNNGLQMYYKRGTKDER